MAHDTEHNVSHLQFLKAIYQIDIHREMLEAN